MSYPEGQLRLIDRLTKEGGADWSVNIIQGQKRKRRTAAESALEKIKSTKKRGEGN